MNSRKVLIVEDSKLVHSMYTLVFSMIQNGDFDLLHALDGFEAFDLLKSNTDTVLIILDMNMPNMNGVEFMQKVQQDRFLKLIPVVIVTTREKDDDIITCLEAGARAYIKKPFQPETFVELINSL